MPQNMNNYFSNAVRLPASMYSLSPENDYWQRQAAQRILDSQADLADRQSMDAVFGSDPYYRRMMGEAAVAGAKPVDDYTRQKTREDELQEGQNKADVYWGHDTEAMRNNQIGNELVLNKSRYTDPYTARAEGVEQAALMRAIGDAIAASMRSQGQVGAAAARALPSAVDPYTNKATPAYGPLTGQLPGGGAQPDVSKGATGSNGSMTPDQVQRYIALRQAQGITPQQAVAEIVRSLQVQ